jgi:hypothetical protein
MPMVESYDITGRHPEKAELEREFQEISKGLSDAKAALNMQSFEDAMDTVMLEPMTDGPIEKIKEGIEDLQARLEEVKDKLFRINPAEDR